MNRREFLNGAVVVGGLAPLLGMREPVPLFDDEEVDVFIRSKMERDHIPGVRVAIFDTERVLWQNTYGWADIARHTPMSLDHLQNIGSISKTFTTTAALQLWEEGLFDLDDDVNEYLPFGVENPKARGEPITFRQLMTHTSSITDGSVYSRHYACGDPRISLHTWLSEYFTPGGHYYNAEENFHPWGPGEQWAYCNVSYGLLAYLVTRISGIPFAEYCDRNIFEPLGMEETSWYLAGINRSKHLVPYNWVENGVVRGSSWGGLPLGVIRPDGPTLDRRLEDGYQPNCLYNHPNFPDGFLRTSVSQIVGYLQTYLRAGLAPDYRLLREETVRLALSPQLGEGAGDSRRGDRVQGLTWYADREIGGELAWGHTGNDPGINNDVRLLPSRGIGAVAFTNTVEIDPWEFTTHLLDFALKRW